MTVPIDEVKAITLKVSPTFERDVVESVTLKSFRKVIGYDTFNSILKKDRNEVKDSADHYNITVSMMVKRVPADLAAAPKADPYNGGKTLSQIIDKGFPYDDGDNSIDDASRIYTKRAPNPATLVGKLNGENVTKEALVNLIKDSDSPITQQLLQLDSDISGDKDNVFKLMDANVTKGQMKNLITDKPAPITVKLAQTNGDKDNVFKLMDANVTKGQMKNLITDKPAPITVKLAQTSGDKDNVFKLMDANVTKGQMKNLITDKPAPITVKLAQTNGDKDNVFKLMDANVTKGQMKNLITDKPAPITVKLAQTNGVPVTVNPTVMKGTGAETEKLGLKMRVGPDVVSVEKKSTQQLAQGVPVTVNPTVMKGTGAETESLGLKMRVGPDQVSVEKKQAKDPMGPTGAEKESLDLKNMKVGGPQDISVSQNLAQKKGVPVLVDPVLKPATGAETEKMDFNMKIGSDKVSVAQKTKLAQASNPVYNPPFNNWSVNQPSPPHAKGLDGHADLGTNMVVDGHPIHV